MLADFCLQFHKTSVNLTNVRSSYIIFSQQMSCVFLPLRSKGNTARLHLLIDLYSSIQFQSINRHLIPRTNSPQSSNPALLFLLSSQILLKRFVAILCLSLVTTSNARIKNAGRIDLLVYPNNHDLLSQSKSTVI